VEFPDYGRVLWVTGDINFPGKPCDFSTYLTKHLIRCWNPNIKFKEKILMQNKPMEKVTAEDVPPQWPVRPLRRPRDPTEVNLMSAVFKKKGTTV
jgi:hypothetical protein